MKHSTNKKSIRMAALALCLTLCTVPVMAAEADPLSIVNNLSNFVFSCIKAVGVIILGWGIVQVGMSIREAGNASHGGTHFPSRLGGDFLSAIIGS